MAYIQKSSPPPNRIQTFTLNNFNGGMSNRSTLLQINEASDVRNMIFYDDSILEKRKGVKYHDNLTLDMGSEIVYIDQWRPYTSADQMVRATRDELYIGSSRITTLSNLRPVIDGTNFQGRYFYVDRSYLYMVSEEADLPSESSTYVRVVGVPVGRTRMRVVNTPSSYTALDNTHVRGVTVYDYNQGFVWYEPCQQEKEDPYLGLSVLPRNPSFIEVHKGRMYISGSSRDNDNVFISQIANPFYFPVALPIQVPPNSDKVTGLAVYDDAVIVGRNDDIHIITGTTNNPELGLEMFQLMRLNVHTGFISNRLVNIAHNFLFFIGSDMNAYALSSARNDTKVIATSMLNQTVDFKTAPFNLTLTQMRNGASYFHGDYWYVSAGDFVFIYSYRHRSWLVWDNIEMTAMFNLDGTLIFGNKVGRICTFDDESYLDLGKPYEAYWYSMWFDMGDPSTFKQFRDFYLTAHSFEKFDSDIRVTFEVDYADISGETVIKNEMSIWGKSVFGDRFINRNINTSSPFTIGRRAKQIRVKIMNSYKVKEYVANVVDLDAVQGKKEGLMVHVIVPDEYYVFRDSTKTWEHLPMERLNQPVRVYQISGEYELRGKR